jgi:hypothetical protein
VWLGLGRAYQAAARVAAGDAGALPEILEGLALVAGTGEQFAAPALFLLLAEAQQATGQFAPAQDTVATALAVAAQTGQHFFDADLHRLEGDLLLATGGDAQHAAARHHHALAIAREQDARSFELRAATSLARLLRDQRKRGAAQELLGPIYGWFTEGLDTVDLVEAKALLAELSPPREIIGCAARVRSTRPRMSTAAARPLPCGSARGDHPASSSFATDATATVAAMQIVIGVVVTPCAWSTSRVRDLSTYGGLDACRACSVTGWLGLLARAARRARVQGPERRADGVRAAALARPVAPPGAQARPASDQVPQKVWYRAVTSRGAGSA